MASDQEPTPSIPATTAPVTLSATGGVDPLAQLYGTLTSWYNSSTQVLNLFPGAFPAGTGPIADLLGYLSAAAGAVINNAQINPPANGQLVVAGFTPSFLSGALTGTIIFSVDTDGKSIDMMMKLSANQPLSFKAIPWFTLQNVNLAVTVSKAAQSYGTVSGGLVLGNLEPVSITATLPVGGGAATFTAAFDSGHQPSLNSLFGLVGGINFGNSLPPQLTGLGGLGIKLVSFDYDFSATELQSFNIEITTSPASPWTLFGPVQLTAFDVLFQVMDPVGERLVSSRAAATFSLPPGTVDAYVFYPDLQVSAALDPNSPAIPLANLVTYFLGSTIGGALPVSGNLTAFDMEVTLGTQTNKFSVQVGFAGNWQLPSPQTPIFTVTNLGFSIAGTSGSVDGQNRQISGEITGSVTINTKPPVNVTLSAAYASATGWTLNGQQSLQTPLTTAAILAAYLPSWPTTGLPNFQLSDLAFTAVTGGSNPYYQISGTVSVQSWSGSVPGPLQGTPFAQVTGKFGNRLGQSSRAAVVAAAANGADAPTKFPFGSVSAELNWRGIHLTLSYNYEPGVQSFEIDWSNFRGVLTNQNSQWTATLAFSDSTTLGSMIETVVSWATGYRFSLGSPWNLLDDISLNGFTITWNFTTGTVSFTVPIGPINLGFCDIESFEVTYNSTQSGSGSSVVVALNGNFPWVTQTTTKSDGTGQSPKQLAWDATKPETTPSQPGGGNKYIDLRLLALGQHIELTGIDKVANVTDAINLMKQLKPPEDGKLPPVKFAAENSWLIGADFGLLQIDGSTDYAVTLQVVFDDPVLYALRLALDGPPAKIFGGLDFQIMYRKISDTLGVYQAQITLPTAMRTIQTGVYTITLPVFAIEVYTNGDFQIDVGFPWNRDFSRSFTVQAIIAPGIPMLGAGGFYFAKLSSASANNVPTATSAVARSLGTFNPVIEFGFGAQIGFGKSISIGPLSASFSLTVLAIIEGIVARWNPFTPSNVGSNPSTQIDGNYYIRLQGTFGIAGTLNGSIDFVIIKASVNISIGVVAQITFESYTPITFSVIAWVDVSASLEIDCGLFTISISFHFSLHLSETFTIQIGSTDAPWYHQPALSNVAEGFLAQPLAFRLRSLREGDMLLAAAPAAPPFQPNWQNLLKGSGVALNGYLQFALTAAGDQATSPSGQTPCYVLSMLVDAPPPPIGAPDPGTSSFDLLCQLVAQWVVAAVPNQVSTNTIPATPVQVSANIVTDQNLQDLLAYLSDPTIPQPILTSDIEAMLSQQVQMTVSGPGDAAQKTTIQGAFFPVPIELQLDIPAYGSFSGYNYSFGNFNQVSTGFIANLRQYFNQLAIQVQQEDQSSQPAPQVAAAETPISVANLVFGDYFVLIARQMVQAMSDGLRDFKYPLAVKQTPQNIVDYVNNTGKLGTGNVVAFALADLFSMNEGQALSTGKPITITGATYTVQAGDTLRSIASAGSFGSAFNAANLADANDDNHSLLQQALTITLRNATYTTQGGDNIPTLVAKLGATSTADLVNNATVLVANTQVPFASAPGLLMTFAKASLPNFIHVTTANDTIQSIITTNAMTPAQLAGGTNNNTIQDLWDTTKVTTLDILHLPQFQVGALLDEALRSGTLQHLSGMISRYHLHGLRLPTPGITPNTAGMWVTGGPGNYQLPPAAGLYALTGQQFPIPPLGSTAFAINVVRGGGPAWLTFKNNSNTISFSVATGSTDASMVTSVFNYVTGGRVVTGYKALGAQSMLSMAPAVFPLGAIVNVLSPAALTLPFGQAPTGPRAVRIWQFTSTFESQLDHYTRINPSFQLQTQTYDDVTKATVSSGVTNYGYATVIEFTVKKIPQAANQSTAASSQTYEIVGAGGSAIVLLENIVSQFGRSDGSFSSLLLAFPTDPSLRTSGIAVDDQSTVTFGIAQTNLSTVTHPSGLGAMFSVAAQPSSFGVLNGIANFVRLLWEASITAQGGYYLYYTNGKSGLPDYAFNDKGQATLSLVVIYANLGDVDGADPIYDIMNAVAVADAIDTTKSVVVLQAAPQPATTQFNQGDTLASVAYRYFADVADIAQDNTNVTIAAGSQLALNSGTYMVSPLGTTPGNTLAAIATYFGMPQQAIIGANPHIPAGEWTGALPAFTAIRLPPSTVTVNTSPGGATLGALAAYYGADPVGLAADNQNVAGLFATQTLTIRGGPVARSSTLPPGSQAILIDRPVPTQVSGPTDPNYGQDLILNNFSLLGFQVQANQDFTISGLGVPVGPTVPNSGPPPGPGKLRQATVLAAGDTWNYKVAIAYGASIVGAGPSASPYLGNGRLLQLDFMWLDLYGNTIFSDLSNPQAGDPGQINHSPILLGYTDPLLAVGQWPSVATDWQVTGTSGNPQLVVDLSFDATRYLQPTESPNGTPAWEKNAQTDLPTYTRLIAQLADPNGIGFSIAASLLTAPIAVDSTQLVQWANAIYAFVADRAKGGTTQPQPTAALSLNNPIASASINPAQIFELTLDFAIVRTGGVVEGEFATVAGVRSASTTVAPLTSGGSLGLNGFATNFETALTQTGASMLKVAVGIDRLSAGAGSQGKAIWAVRVGIGAGPGIAYTIGNVGAPYIYAPAPISTNLESRQQVPIYDYTPGSGTQINFATPSYYLDFANIDLDQWVQSIFLDVDNVLTPEFTSSIMVLEKLTKGSYLASLLDTKGNLAKLYSFQMKPVFDDQSSAPTGDVQEAFRQELLERLGNAYTTQAALQYEASVTAAVGETPPPNIYGAVVPAPGSSVPSGVTFTSAKFPLQQTSQQSPASVISLVTTPTWSGGDESASNVPVNLNFATGAIEHQIGSLSGISGYLASSWLTFVLPSADPTVPGSLAAQLGPTTIPMVLRAYPSNPALLSQLGTETYPTTTALNQLTQWTYTLSYTLDFHYPQDTVHCTVEFNIKPAMALLASFEDAFGAMAEFMTVYPKVKTDLVGSLAGITPATTDSTTIKVAEAAIQSFNGMLAKIAPDNGVAALTVVRKPPRLMGTAAGGPLQLAIQETPADITSVGTAVLAVTITIENPGPSGAAQPMVYVGTDNTTYTPKLFNSEGQSFSYYYLDAKSIPLLFTTAQAIPRRNLVLAGMQILDLQDALASAYVVRNANLVTGRTTNGAFVYQTPPITFNSVCQPTISSDQPIDIAKIAIPQSVNPNDPPPKRPLADQLTALFTNLTEAALYNEMIVQVVVYDSYPITQTALPITLPVLMQPPLNVTIRDPLAGVTPLPAMIADLAAAIKGWFASKQPSMVGNSLRFELTIMASLTQQPMPLLQLTNLDLSLSYVSDIPSQ